MTIHTSHHLHNTMKEIRSIIASMYATLCTKYIQNSKFHLLLRRLSTGAILLLVVSHSVKDYNDISRILHSKAVHADEVALPNSRIVDIVSVGSLLKEAFHDAQERTFGNHSSVRNFFRITERTDADQECFISLSSDQLNAVIDFCKSTTPTSSMSNVFRKWLFNPKKNAGWMCAQKRPIDGLYHVLQTYKNGNDLPKYLFIVDDDTYINMDHLIPILLNDFPYNTTHVVAGCNFKFLKNQQMPFPYGGFGTFLTRSSIERLLRPIHCIGGGSSNMNTSDPFNRLACWRMDENLMGEKLFFTDGMSMIDLLYQVSKQQPFSNASNWSPQAGYCFHSDHALAYFFNMYHIAVPDSAVTQNFRYGDHYRKKYKYTALHGFSPDQNMEGECYNNHPNDCHENTTVCHYMQPTDMLNKHRT